jgi:hypothetical protein
MSDPLNLIERIEIERACERLVHAYGRALDVGDMDAAANCFAEAGAMARPMTPHQIVRSREAIRASLATRPKSLLTRHLATNVTIDVENRDAASGFSYLTMIACSPIAGVEPPFEAPGPLYFGEFRDRFVRVDGEWKFLERLGSIQMKY